MCQTTKVWETPTYSYKHNVDKQHNMWSVCKVQTELDFYKQIAL